LTLDGTLLDDTILALWGAGSLLIAMHIMRIPVLGGLLSERAWYALVLAVVVVAAIAGAGVSPWPVRLDWMSIGVLAAAPAAGFVAYRIDQRIVRRLSGPARMIGREPSALPLLMAIAVLEELVYRGLLLDFCFRLPGFGWQVTGVAGMTIWFALVHVWYGWVHVAAKAPLSIVATALALLGGGPAAAVLAHVMFNYQICRRGSSLGAVS